jgi:hypothetical protein
LLMVIPRTIRRPLLYDDVRDHDARPVAAHPLAALRGPHCRQYAPASPGGGPLRTCREGGMWVGFQGLMQATTESREMQGHWVRGNGPCILGVVQMVNHVVIGFCKCEGLWVEGGQTKREGFLLAGRGYSAILCVVWAGAVSGLSVGANDGTPLFVLDWSSCVVCAHPKAYELKGAEQSDHALLLLSSLPFCALSAMDSFPCPTDSSPHATFQR